MTLELSLCFTEWMKLFGLGVILCFGINLGLSQYVPVLEKLVGDSSSALVLPNEGPRPDYQDLKYWAAHPNKKTKADSVPSGLPAPPASSTRPADVFYIHPTTYLALGSEVVLQNPLAMIPFLNEVKTKPWNASLEDASVNKLTDKRPILYQASVFNHVCRVYAPRYRQVHLKTFFVLSSGAGQEALNLAYGDIKAAFEQFLKETGDRPIVIAGHSQGTVHAIRLLQEYFDDKELYSRLVCAYLVGWATPSTLFKHIPLGTSSLETQCYVSWRSYQQGQKPMLIALESAESTCINPLTWTTKAGWVEPAQNKGTLYYFDTLKEGVLGAELAPEQPIIWVKLPDDVPEKIQSMPNLHVYDYNLFWMNIRQNVGDRVGQFLQKKKPLTH